MACEITSWNASTSNSGGVRTLYIHGEGECTETGNRLELSPDNEGIVDDPELVVLRLTVTPADTGNDILVPAAVDFAGPIDRQVRRVQIRVPDFADVKLELSGDEGEDEPY